MDFYLFDSVKKEKLKFSPIKSGEVSIYVCGPTVYDDAHLGHARSALSFDLLKRTLSTLGLRVTLAKNFTDIDDKIINKLQDSDKTLEELTQFYIDRYLEDMEKLAVLRADLEPKATQNLDAIESMINKLLEKDCAYVIDNGDVYFDTSKDTKYGSISHMVTDDEQNISRVEGSEQKRNPKDFALWKACKERDVCFDAEVGSGRPGWHIECSAMINKLFSGSEEYNIDIHCGGADLLFPHHENEAAQTRCATNKEIAKYWMHNGFVQIDGEKMSKSLGNSFFLKDALELYNGELIRYYLISVYYRNDFNFNQEDLEVSKKRLDKIYRLKKRLYGSKVANVNKAFKEALLAAMCDDLNSSKAMAIIDEMVTNANEKLDIEPKNKALKQEILGNIEFICNLLGIGCKDAIAWFQQGVSDEDKEKIEHFLAKRAEAKKAKDFATADAIRDELAQMGIAIMDTPDGTKWEKL
ncbi:MAG TPA: cysteine--tRNA ligase [Nitratifractor sp.]|nr:cysteine--tRNA ligase [Nitratifractor sp.]